jgi:hypothetical protein
MIGYDADSTLFFNPYNTIMYVMDELSKKKRAKTRRGRDPFPKL